MFLSFEHEFYLAAIDQCLAWHDKKAKDEQFIVLGFMIAETRRQLTPYWASCGLQDSDNVTLSKGGSDESVQY